MTGESLLFKEMRKEVADKARERRFLPTYLFEEDEKQNIIRELSLEKGDDRYRDAFNCLCDYAIKENSPHLNFKDFFDYLLKTDMGKAFGQVNLKYNVEFLVKKLKEHHYVDMVKSKNEERILNFTLKEPCFLTIKQYLDGFYGKKNDYIADASQLSKVLLFPSYLTLSKKFNFSVERIISNSHVLKEDQISQDNLEIDGLHKLLVLEFFNQNSEVNKINSFEIVVGLNSVEKIVNNSLIPIVFELIEKNPKLKKAIEESYIKYEGGAPISFKEEFENIGVHHKDFIKWISHCNRFIEDSDFIEHPNKFLVNLDIDKNLISKTKNFIIKSIKLISAYTHGFIMYERKIKKKNEDKEEDQKLVIKYLCDGIKEVKNKMGGVSELSYKLATWNDICEINDLSGKKKLEEKYSNADILELLSLKNDNLPKIIELKMDGDKFYFHNWRTIDVFSSLLALESSSVYQNLIQEWSTCDVKRIPSIDKFFIKISDLDPKFSALYNHITKFFEAYSDEYLLKILFPNDLESRVYKLHTSDLINIQKYNFKTRSFERISPKVKLQGVKNILYSDGDTLKKLSLAEVLGLDYKKILRLAKKKKKQVSHKKEWSLIERILDFLIGWLFDSKNKANKSHKNSQKINASASDVRFSLNNIAKKFHIPERRMDIEERLSSLHDDWNKVIFDPKIHYPNWPTFSPAKKEKLKKTLKDDLDKSKKDNKERVDKVVKKTYSQVDLLKISDAELTNIANKLAKMFKSRNHHPLREYIKYYIIYINTK